MRARTCVLNQKSYIAVPGSVGKRGMRSTAGRAALDAAGEGAGSGPRRLKMPQDVKHPSPKGQMSMGFTRLRELILVEHTLFAMFLACLGILFAGGGRIVIWVWVAIALIAAHTAGIALNRLVDADADKRIQRARNRLLPRGELSGGEARILAAGSCAALVFASYMLNSLCFYLSFAAIVLLISCSYLKRLGAASHLYPGCVEAAAPVGGYLAVTGEFDLMPFVIGAAVMTWITGLDLVRALPDMESDRGEGIRSIPVAFGRESALAISSGLYAASFAALAAGGALAKKGIAYWVAVLCVALIFFRQQSLARKEDITQTSREIFQINSYIPLVLFIGTFIDVFMG